MSQIPSGVDPWGYSLRPATWEDALERIVAAIERAQQRYGKDAVGIFGGGSLTNEKAYRWVSSLRTSQMLATSRAPGKSPAAA